MLWNTVSGLTTKGPKNRRLACQEAAGQQHLGCSDTAVFILKQSVSRWVI